jgi:hypothetical protein
MITVKIDTRPVFEILGKLDMLQPGNSLNEKITRVVATSINAEMRDRIHSKGLKADGSPIGTYSTKPTYVSAIGAGKAFAPVGKTGKTKFASGQRKGKEHTSRYFPDGYAGYKKIIGRDTLGGKVNLFLSGTLSNQFTLQADGNSYGLGWPGDKQFKIAQGMEKKYGPIWSLTADENKLVTDIVNNELQNAFS